MMFYFNDIKALSAHFIRFEKYFLVNPQMKYLNKRKFD